ncbi:MAG: helix-turn-helix transcriptional regulator [Gemmatimonadales bacterium]
MNSITPGLAGQKGLRGEILLHLKKSQPITAKELGDSFGVSANAVRRHLKELEAAGLVDYEREQRGTGAPTFAYRLSGDGEALFPTQYDRALTDVLSFVAQNDGREAVKRMFAERFRAHSDRIRAELGGASLEKRVEALVELLSSQGFMAVWSAEKDTLMLAEHNCAVRSAAEQFPEICQAEVDFLEDVLQSEVRREAYIPEGCNACLYTISRNPGPETASRVQGQG